MAPVRANGRGTRADHAICTVIVSPGPTGRSSGTSITVRSSGLPSSGEMKRAREVRSVGVPPLPIARKLVRSIQPQSDSDGPVAVAPPLKRHSRIHEELVFRQAL